MLPLYLEKLTLDELRQRSQKLLCLLNECKICPNNCGSNRYQGFGKKCRSSADIEISSIGPHYGEEPPLVGQLGSGTIFFTNCNLDCKFCQNFDISHEGRGQIISIEQLAAGMLNLQNRGCHNINLVTPTHFTPQIIDALILAVESGLEIPLVYNCGGYESIETLKLLKDIIDIYMPDIKYSSDENARIYSGIPNYWETVKSAVKEMHRQIGDLKISRRGTAQRGLLIRHLVMPNDIAGSKKVIDFIAKEISLNSYLNIMDQYRPSYKAFGYEKINRHINEEEYYSVVKYAKEMHLNRGFE